MRKIDPFWMGIAFFLFEIVAICVGFASYALDMPLSVMISGTTSWLLMIAPWALVGGLFIALNVLAFVFVIKGMNK